MQINSVIIEGCFEINTEYLKILKNIDLSAITFNTKYFILFLFGDILQISLKKTEKIFIKVIQCIIFKNLSINNGNKNSTHTDLRYPVLYHNNISRLCICF